VVLTFAVMFAMLDLAIVAFNRKDRPDPHKVSSVSEWSDFSGATLVDVNPGGPRFLPWAFVKVSEP